LRREPVAYGYLGSMRTKPGREFTSQETTVIGGLGVQ
jgi:hypothetical protein